MTEIFESAVLGIIQGLTEFLPISSSGHLIVLPQIFGWSGVVSSLSFDVAVHLGSLLALVAFFWKDWIRLTTSFLTAIPKGAKAVVSDSDSKLLILLLIGSIPAAIIGILFKEIIENSFRSVLLVGTTTIIFGILLWLFDTLSSQQRKFFQVGWVDSIVVGVAQAVSLIPGVSRSGITITASRFQKLERGAAVRFSFLLSTPAVLGAGLISVKDFRGADLTIFFSGFIFASISGWLAIKFLLGFVQKNNFNIFVIYRIIFGAFLIAWALLNF